MAVTSTSLIMNQSPYLNSRVNYTMSRSGGNLRVRGTVEMWVTQYGGWMADPWYVDIVINGTRVRGKTQVKGNTGIQVIQNRKYTLSFDRTIATNASSVKIQVGYSFHSYLSASRTWTLSSGGTSPSGPSKPSVTLTPTTTTPDGSMKVGISGAGNRQIQIEVNGTWRWVTQGSNTNSYNIDLKQFKPNNGSRVRVSVRSYYTYNGKRFYSGWTNSPYRTVKFNPPGPIKNINYSRVGEPTERITVSIGAPDYKGSNGISGYQYRLSVDGKDYVDIANTTNTSVSFIPSHYGARNGSSIRVAVRAYTIGYGIRYYNSFIYGSTHNVWYSLPTTPIVSLNTNNGFEGVSTLSISGANSGSGKFIKNEIYATINGRPEYLIYSGTSNIYNFRASELVNTDSITIKFRVRRVNLADGIEFRSDFYTTNTVSMTLSFPNLGNPSIIEPKNPSGKMTITYNKSKDFDSAEIICTRNNGSEFYISNSAFLINNDTNIEIDLEKIPEIEHGDNISFRLVLKKRNSYKKYPEIKIGVLRYNLSINSELVVPEEIVINEELILKPIIEVLDIGLTLKAHNIEFYTNNSKIKETNVKENGTLKLDLKGLVGKSVSKNQTLEIVTQPIFSAKGREYKGNKKTYSIRLIQDTYIQISVEGKEFLKAKLHLIRSDINKEITKEYFRVLINGEEKVVK